LAGAYVWKSDKMHFQQLNLEGRGQIADQSPTIDLTPPARQTGLLPFTEERGAWKVEEGVISVDGAKKGSGVIASTGNLDPFKYDFIQFDLSMSSGAARRNATVYWKGENDGEEGWADANSPIPKLLPRTREDTYQTVRLPLSNRWRWFSGGGITGVRVEMSPCQNFKMRNFKIVASGLVAPSIALLDVACNNMGVYAISGQDAQLSVEGSKVQGCSQLQLEISKPNYFFENMPDDASGEAVLNRVTQPTSGGKVTLPARLFPEIAYYQIRAVCLDAQGEAVGEKSDPVTIYMASKPR
jgi:hypothetical protein